MAEIDAHGSSARATTVGCEIAAGFQQVCNQIASQGYGSDQIRLLATASLPNGTPVAVVFYWLLDGSVDGIGAWGASGSLTLIGNNPLSPLAEVSANYSTGGVAVQATQASYSESRTFTAILNVGQIYTGTTRLDASSAVRTCPFGTNSCSLPLGIDVDFTDGALVGARPLGSGFESLELLGDSGRNYLVPLPEPQPAHPSILFLMLAVASDSARAW